VSAPAAAHPRQQLLEDGVLGVTIDPRVRPWVERWLPRYPRGGGPAAPGAAIEIGAGSGGEPPPGPPLMEMHGVGGWIVPGEGLVVTGAGGAVGARVDLERRAARVRVRADRDPPSVVQVVSALTMVSGVLLAAVGRALVHAAAVVPPGGDGAWLLAGGSFGGKTTTCVTLIQAGWDWLSDDDVVLGPAGQDGVRAAGWPRRFDLDHGHGTAAPAGVRSRVDPERFGPGGWRGGSALAGVVFPRVQAELPTRLAPLHPAEAMARLVHHAPWLLADARGAGDVLKVLERSVRLPAYELRLGLDSYCNASRLQFALRQLFSAKTRAQHGVET
jgi:hypothetical protein